MNRADGSRTPWSAWTVPPTLTADGRLDGQVSDSAIGWILPDLERNDVWVGTLGDGGNSVLRSAPADHTDRTSPGDYWTGDLSSMRGRVLFWGGLTRITALDEQPALTFARALGWHDTDRRGRRAYQDGWISAATWWNEHLVVVGRGIPGWDHSTAEQRRDAEWLLLPYSLVMGSPYGRICFLVVTRQRML